MKQLDSGDIAEALTRDGDRRRPPAEANARSRRARNVHPRLIGAARALVPAWHGLGPAEGLRHPIDRLALRIPQAGRSGRKRGHLCCCATPSLPVGLRTTHARVAGPRGTPAAELSSRAIASCTEPVGKMLRGRFAGTSGRRLDLENSRRCELLISWHPPWSRCPRPRASHPWSQRLGRALLGLGSAAPSAAALASVELVEPAAWRCSGLLLVGLGPQRLRRPFILALPQTPSRRPGHWCQRLRRRRR